MTRSFRILFVKAIVFLCLGASSMGFVAPFAEAAPLSGLSQSVSGIEAANPALIQKTQYYRHRWHHRHYYRPIQCHRVIGWHRTRYGTVFGPYRRCYR